MKLEDLKKELKSWVEFSLNNDTHPKEGIFYHIDNEFARFRNSLEEEIDKMCGHCNNDDKKKLRRRILSHD